MDKFNSAIFYREMSVDVNDNDRPIGLNINHDLFGNDGDEEPEHDLVIDTAAWGWWDGGLARLLKLQRDLVSKRGEVMFFRGAALFDNIDDAKNDYLMNPEVEALVNREGEGYSDLTTFEEDQHVPFGMVIPQWKADHSDHGDDFYLASVTIILYWQPLV